jgi:hypothetical protein
MKTCKSSLASFGCSKMHAIITCQRWRMRRSSRVVHKELATHYSVHARVATKMVLCPTNANKGWYVAGTIMKASALTVFLPA